MKDGARRYKDLPLDIVGSTKFGRYNKISDEQTINMIISDGWNVPFAGYKVVSRISDNGQGRGIYSSQKLNKLFTVVDNKLYYYDTNLQRTFAGVLNTNVGNVYISENNSGQVVISDQQYLYITDNTGQIVNVLSPVTLGFTPGYLTFQNGRFISPNITSNLWRLSALNNGNSWPAGSNLPQFEGALQTKPDTAVATLRFPGRGNLLLVFGKTVTELWNDVGAALFPYQRNQSLNIDYGCLNPATIAESENIICWLAANEKSGPTIMYTTGGDLEHISNDGIDFKLAQLKNPTDSYGFMFKQDGHLFYVIIFVSDNVSYAYDFNTKLFFTLTDENMNVFIAKRVAFFNEQYYFVSIRDGNLYELSSNITEYDYGNGNIYEIPRVRITAPINLPDQSRFRIGYAGFTIEQGQFNYPENPAAPKINISMSKDGATNFGSKQAIFMNSLGKRANRLMWWQLGSANDLTFMFEFYGFDRFVAKNGIVGIYQ